MENCYSFHTFLLRRLKELHTLDELVEKFNNLACCVDKHKLSKWINGKHPIPQRFLPALEDLCRKYLSYAINSHAREYFSTT